MRHISRPFALAALIVLAAVPSHASVLLTFEGLQNAEDILDFYNGGTGSLGSVGPDFNIVFGPDARASIDSDAGGTGNFANEPSGDTVGVFFAADTVIMNVLDGFENFFSFFYASFNNFEVTVYSGLDGTGAVLGSVALPLNGPAPGFCDLPGDPNGQANCWDPGLINFAGTAHSVRYVGVLNRTGFDNVVLGGFDEDVPEPGLLALLGFSLTGVIAARRKRATKTAR